jgi:hypothetical protein
MLSALPIAYGLQPASMLVGEFSAHNISNVLKVKSLS